MRLIYSCSDLILLSIVKQRSIKMSTDFQVRLPDNIKDLPINEEYFFITENGQELRLKLHDYAEVCGLFGQAVAQVGVTSIIGIDIVPEAAEACRRDYPGVYEDYFKVRGEFVTGLIIGDRPLPVF